jgi:hypothetical protein
VGGQYPAQFRIFSGAVLVECLQNGSQGKGPSVNDPQFRLCAPAVLLRHSSRVFAFPRNVSGYLPMSCSGKEPMAHQVEGRVCHPHLGDHGAPQALAQRPNDRVLEGVTCIRLDSTVVTAHSDKGLAEANFKGYGHHPLLAACGDTGGRAGLPTTDSTE